MSVVVRIVPMKQIRNIVVILVIAVCCSGCAFATLGYISNLTLSAGAIIAEVAQKPPSMSVPPDTEDQNAGP